MSKIATTTRLVDAGRARGPPPAVNRRLREQVAYIDNYS
jgi:hypothetical protein